MYSKNTATADRFNHAIRTATCDSSRRVPLTFFNFVAWVAITTNFIRLGILCHHSLESDCSTRQEIITILVHMQQVCLMYLYFGVLPIPSKILPKPSITF